MSHAPPQPSVDDRRQIFRVTLGSTLVNIALSAMKIEVGIWGNSQALVADGIHSFSDLATDAAVFIGARFWLQPADERHPHGHAKIESLVTLFIALALTIVGIGLATHAIQELRDFTEGASLEPPRWIALIAALSSIAIKEALSRWTSSVGRKVHSPAVIANAWHHRTDALSSIPVALAIALCLAFGPRYAFLDPVGTIVVATFVFYAAWKNACPALAALMDEGFSPEKLTRLIALVEAHPGVKRVAQVRTRALGQDTAAVELYIQVDGDLSVRKGDLLAREVRGEIVARFPEVLDVAVHVEPDSVVGNPSRS